MSVFVTGGAGFVGRHFLARFGEPPLDSARCLVRRRGLVARERFPGLEEIRGDLLEPATWEPALAGCDTVVHIAALTGKGTFDDHDRANHVATRLLVEASLRAGVARFLHVSTIAVVFPEKRHYPYALSKTAAENVVRSSGLDWAIVRPTIVLGPESPLWDKFEALASAPITPVFGSGKNRVNPVHVEDVVEGMLALLGDERLGGRTVELGGRDILPMEDFLRALRVATRHREGPMIRIPIAPVIGLLSILGRFAMRVLPVSAGQFYAFRYDTVARVEPQDRPPVADRRGVTEMIDERNPGE